MVEYFKDRLNLLAWICLKCGCSNLRTEHGLFSRGISIPVCSDKNVIESISKNGIIFKSTIISIDEDDLKKMNVEDRLKALQKLEKKEKAIQSELMSYLNERYGSDKSFPNLCSEIHESKQSAITKIKGIAGIILNS